MRLPPDLFAAPFRMQPGLRRSAPGARHFTPLAGSEPVFAEKLRIVADHADQALLLQPGFDARPALARIARVLCAEHPQAFALDGAVLRAQRLGLALQLDGGELRGADAGDDVLHALNALEAARRPWGLLALALHEDLAVPHGADGTLGALAVCVPSHWNPQDKIGRPFVQVHAPVADNALLLAAAQALMKLVMAGEGGDPWERHVWTITPEARYDAHPLRQPHRAWPCCDDALAFVRALQLRLERQTFIAVPGAAQAVFTIKVDMAPLAGALRERGTAQALHDALASMSDAVLRYRGFTAVRPQLLEGLLRLADALDTVGSIMPSAEE